MILIMLRIRGLTRECLEFREAFPLGSSFSHNIEQSFSRLPKIAAYHQHMSILDSTFFSLCSFYYLAIICTIFVLYIKLSAIDINYDSRQDYYWEQGKYVFILFWWGWFFDCKILFSSYFSLCLNSSFEIIFLHLTLHNSKQSETEGRKFAPFRTTNASNPRQYSRPPLRYIVDCETFYVQNIIFNLIWILESHLTAFFKSECVWNFGEKKENEDEANKKNCFEMSEEVASMASGNAEEAKERKVHHSVMRSRVCRRLNVRYREEEKNALQTLLLIRCTWNRARSHAKIKIYEKDEKKNTKRKWDEGRKKSCCCPIRTKRQVHVLGDVVCIYWKINEKWIVKKRRKGDMWNPMEENNDDDYGWSGVEKSWAVIWT